MIYRIISRVFRVLSGTLTNSFKLSRNKFRDLPVPPGYDDLKFLARIGEHVSTKDVVFEGLNLVGHRVHFSNHVEIGYATTIREECWIRGPLVIGRYCQLGPRVCLHATDHNLDYLTTYNNQALFNGDLKKFIHREQIRIGHGVYLGYGAIVLKGINIGNGAVIGAGAVVTRDVQPYQIVAGNPARLIRLRFEDEICDLIEQTKWWMYKADELQPFGSLFQINLNQDEKFSIILLREFIEQLGIRRYNLE